MQGNKENSCTEKSGAEPVHLPRREFDDYAEHFTSLRCTHQEQSHSGKLFIEAIYKSYTTSVVRKLSFIVKFYVNYYIIHNLY